MDENRKRLGLYGFMTRNIESMKYNLEEKLESFDYMIERAKELNDPILIKSFQIAKNHIQKSIKKIENLDEHSYQEWDKLWNELGQPYY